MLIIYFKFELEILFQLCTMDQENVKEIRRQRDEKPAMNFRNLPFAKDGLFFVRYRKNNFQAISRKRMLYNCENTFLIRLFAAERASLGSN